MSAERENPRFRWRRRLGKAAAFVLGACALLLTLSFLALFFLDTPRGKAALIGWLNQSLASSGFHAEALHGRLYSDFRIREITISDQSGAFMLIPEVRVRWVPRALLSGRIAILSIAALEADWRDLPEGAGRGAGGDDTPLRIVLPDLPLDLAIGEIALERLRVAPDVFGVETALRLAAALSYETGSRMSLRLALETPGTIEDSLHIVLALGQDNALTLAAELEGAPGGLVAAAARLRTGTGLSATIDGHGRIDRWEGDLAISAVGYGALSGGLSGTDGRIVFDGRFHDDGLIPHISSNLDLDDIGILLSMESSKNARIPVTLEATAPELKLALTQTFDRNDLAVLDLDFALDLAREGLGLAGGVQIDGGRLSGRLSGHPERIDVALEGRAHGLRIAGRDMPSLAFGLDGHYARKTIALDAAHIEAGAARLDLLGEVARDGDAFALEGRLSIASLADLAPGLPADARLDLRVSASRRAGSDAIAGALSGDVRDLRGLPEAALSLIGQQVALSAEGRYELAGGPLHDLKATLDAEGTTLLLSGMIDPSAARLGLDFRLAFPDLSAVLEAVPATGGGSSRLGGSGALALEGSLRGTFDRPELRAEAALDALSLGAIRIAEPALSLRVDDPLGGGEALFSLAGTSPYGVFSLAARGRLLPEGGAALPAIDLALGPASFSGTLAISDDGLLMGRLAGGSADLSRLPDGMRARPRGSFDLALDLAPREGVQALELELTGQDLFLPAGSAESLELAYLELSGDVRLVSGRPEGELDLVMRALNSGFLRLDEGRIAAQGGRDGLTLSARLDGDWRGPLALHAALLWTGGDEADLLDLSAEGTLFGLPMTARRIAIRRQAGRIEVAPFGLDLGTGRFEGEAVLGESDSHMAARLEHFALPVLNLFLARPLPAGSVDADIALSAKNGEKASGKGVFRLSLEDDGGGLFPTLPALVMTGRAALSPEGRLDLRAEGSSEGGKMHFAGRLAVPLHLALRPFAAGLPPSAPLSGALEWQGDIAPLALLAGLDNNRITGALAADLAISGRVDVPQLQGVISLRNGGYENLLSGFLLEGLALDARFADGRLEIGKLSAGDGRGGQLSGHGEIRLGPPLEARLDLSLASLAAVRRDDLLAVLSGDIALSLGPNGPGARGKIHADRVDLSLDRRFRSEVVSLEVEEVGGSIGEEEEDSPSWNRPLALDIELGASRRLFVRGRGLDSEWQADLMLDGDSETPRLAGEARLLSGRFDFAGFRFTLSDGSLIFAGGERIDPFLSLVARERIGDIDVTLRLEGSLSAPSLSFESSPPLPEDEILARILFGGSTGELSVLQALELAQTISRLRGGGGFDPIGSMRRSLGLDRLDVGFGENDNGARISGGKYLTDKVYLEVESETATGITTGTLLWSLTRQLSIRGRIGSGGENSVFLRWSIDY